MKRSSICFIGICAILLFNCSTRKPSEPALGIVQTTAGEPEVLAENLDVPWGMGLLPDGNLIFNERSGRISMLNMQTKVITPLMERDISARFEGGLLGLAVDPQFATNGFIFIYETVESGNRIVRLHYADGKLIEDKILLDSIPKKQFHDGGVLQFGPDEFLYVGTGDAREPESAQDMNSNAGKILRMDRAGNIPQDNPFNNYVWSYGHRNVQGLCWTADGTMFSTEHGPSGELNGWCCNDEVNIIVKGNNYGWPKVIGSNTQKGLQLPFAHSGEDTWAPGGIIYMDNFDQNAKNSGSLIFACLKGERLVQFNISDDDQNKENPLNASEIQLYAGTYGRLRNIIKTKEGAIIFCTSNKDGRGKAEKNDDRIFIIR